MNTNAMPNHRVLVTGALGFVGSYLLEALVKEGWQITALDLKENLPNHLKNIDAIKVIRGNINELKNLDEIVDQVDAVCHLAAFIPPDYEDPSYAEACIKSNGLATLRLALLVSKHPAQRFIYLSAGNAYFHSDTLVSENDLIYPSERATYYITSKIVGELFIEHLRHSRNLQALSLRISTPYGFGMSQKSVITRFMENASKGQSLEVFDNGISTYDYIYVKDVANIIVEALKNGEPGVYNVGSGIATSTLDLAHTVANLFPDRRTQINITPPKGLLPASFSALCIDKAIKMWNFHPVSLNEGLTDYRLQMEQSISDNCNHK